MFSHLRVSCKNFWDGLYMYMTHKSSVEGCWPTSACSMEGRSPPAVVAHVLHVGLVVVVHGGPVEGPAPTATAHHGQGRPHHHHPCPTSPATGSHHACTQQTARERERLSVRASHTHTHTERERECFRKGFWNN